jgi:hypothetical protein
MEDARNGTSTRAEPKTLGRLLMSKILAFVEECIIANYKAQGPEWALRPVRVEQQIEVVRR